MVQDKFGEGLPEDEQEIKKRLFELKQSGALHLAIWLLIDASGFIIISGNNHSQYLR
jgi:hypothetical protein